MKSALRINLSASYGKITILLNYLPLADTPYPAVPDFPRKREQNKALKSNPFISSSQHSGAL